jgi:hypothetical protein
VLPNGAEGNFEVIDVQIDGPLATALSGLGFLVGDRIYPLLKLRLVDHVLHVGKNNGTCLWVYFVLLLLPLSHPSPLCLVSLRSKKVHVRVMIHGLLVGMSECRRLIWRVLVIAYEWLQAARTAPICPDIPCRPLLRSLLCDPRGHLLDVPEIVAVGSN